MTHEQLCKFEATVVLALIVIIIVNTSNTLLKQSGATFWSVNKLNLSMQPLHQAYTNMYVKGLVLLPAAD